ncbi:MAG: hypothetical protein LBE50_01165 [Gallionellaceae bacterium]|jgi:cytochrome c551/c552|nr:hypothetical protein [Gallionellaceae bacterium]
MKFFIVAAMVAAGLMTAASASAETTKMPNMVKKAGFYCQGCHKVDKDEGEAIGPSWRDVSRFYNGKLKTTYSGKTLQEVAENKAPREFLIDRITRGGKGSWGKYPMIANEKTPRVSLGHDVPSEVKQAQIEEIIDWVLKLEK